MRKEPLIRIVDDNESLRESLSFMLECEGYKVAAYESAEKFVAEDAPSIPGILILDVMMPGMSGLELQNLLNLRCYEHPIIFLTGHGDIDMAVETMREGACDFQQKPVNPETFLPAVARALEKDRKRFGGVQDLKEEVSKYRQLTDREKEILQLIAKGCVSRVIAERLNISKRTVDHLRSSGLQKVGLRTPAELSSFFERVKSFGKALQ